MYMWIIIKYFFINDNNLINQAQQILNMVFSQSSRHLKLFKFGHCFWERISAKCSIIKKNFQYNSLIFIYLKLYRRREKHWYHRSQAQHKGDQLMANNLPIIKLSQINRPKKKWWHPFLLSTTYLLSPPIVKPDPFLTEDNYD